MARPRDPLFEALLDALEWRQADLTASSRGAVNKALVQLRDAHATPDMVRFAPAAWALMFPRDRPLLTPGAIAKHWNEIARRWRRRQQRALGREVSDVGDVPSSPPAAPLPAAEQARLARELAARLEGGPPQK